MFIQTKFKIYSVIIFLYFVFFPHSVSAANLIQNNGFENGQNMWTPTTTNVASLEITSVSGEKYEGSQSASLKVTTTESSHGIKQKINAVTGGQQYKINGYVKTLTAPEEAYIRIAWYEEGKTSQLPTTNNSTKINTIVNWSLLDFIVTSPESAASAEIRLYVKNGIAYFDDITMEEYTESTIVTTVFSAPSTTPTPLPNYNNIYISEAMVAPNTGEKEWVELYNDNDFSVTLSDWYIDDIADSGSSPKKISITISAKSYGVIELSTSIFNNSGDTVGLLDFSGNEKNTFTYDYSESGKTWGWSELKNDIFCLQQPSKNTQNTACTQGWQPSTKSTQTSSEATVSTSKTKDSTRSSQSSTSNSSLKSYAIAVTPPTIFREGTVESEQSVLSATTSQIDPHASPGYLPLLAASYSLLSIGSLVTKMIYS